MCPDNQCRQSGLSTPNGAQLDTALGQLDYMVSIDIYLNESSRHANIILPPLASLERSQYDLAFQALAIRNGAKFSQPVFKPKPHQRSDAQIFTELAWRMQSGNLVSKTAGWFKKVFLQWLGSDWVINRKLKQGPYFQSHGLDLKKLKQNPHGIDLGAMHPCLPDRLFTRDKMIQLAPDEFVSDLQKLSDRLAERTESPDLQEHDMLLIGRRDPRTNNSWLHNSHRLVKGKSRCLAIIHPEDARQRDLEQGDIALVRSRVGSISIPVKLSDEIMPGVISIPHGWGHNPEGMQMNTCPGSPGR